VTNKPEPIEKPEPAVRVVDRRWWARADAGASTDEPLGRKPTYVEDLERQLADKAAQLQTLQTEHRRAIDEFEQIKGRIRRDVGREVERGTRAVLAELLEVLDNLDRAIAAGTVPDAALLKGVQLVRDQFRAKLQGFGVSRIDVIGQPFDATRHEAVSIAPVTDPAQDGIVTAVAREGYAIGEELLRPAAVVVGRLQG
jgi:molecular chaperone GrpE